MYDTEKRIELIKKLFFTVAVVITALCIKFRNRGQKSQDAEDHVLKKEEDIQLLPTF